MTAHDTYRRIEWHVLHRVDTWGARALLGMALGSAGLVMLVYALLVQRPDIKASEGERTAIEAQIAELQRAAALSRAQPAAGPAGFDSRRMSALLARAAAASGVTLGDVSYAAIDTGSSIESAAGARTQATVAVVSPYASAKRFIGEVLNREPAVSLISLRMQAAASGARLVESQFVFVAGAPPAQPSRP